MQWNLGPRHWNNKRDDVQLLTDQFKPDFLFITEANLYNDTPGHEVEIEGYNMIRAKTTSRLGYSRIVLLCKTGNIYSVESDRMDDDISSVWIKIGGRGRKGLLLGGMYREHTLVNQPEPNNHGEPIQQEYRWNKFLKQWKAAGDAGPCLVMGDMNIDMLTWNTPDFRHENMVNNTKHEIITRNFSQLINGPTRFWQGARPTLIDHCWANTPERVSNIKNQTRGTADHNLTAATYRLSGTITSNIVRKCRDRKNFSEEELRRRVSITDWSPVFETENVDIVSHEFETRFAAILDQLAPIKTVQPRSNRSDWISRETLNLMDNRDRAREQAVRTNHEEDWSTYRRLRNLCTAKIKSDRNKNLKEKYEKYEKEKDSAGLYKFIKRKMGWKSQGNPEFFLMAGQKITNPKLMADLQVNHYHDKVKKLIEELPQQSEDPLNILKRTIERWGRMNTVQHVRIQPVGIAQTTQIIKEMNGSTAYGHDGIDMKAIKSAVDGIAAPITYIINLSIEKQKFPSRWKMGRIVPIYKGGNKSPNSTESFRPISLLPAVSKIAEKVVCQQLTRHMDSNRLWNQNLHSYRKSLSSITAIAQVHDALIEASEDKNIAAAIAIDESAAFDSIAHPILLDKMRLYNFHEDTIKWIKDYLLSRSQYVTIGGKDSVIKSVETGILQGSTLGPTLFNLYINDFPDIVNDHGSCQEEEHTPGESLYGRNCKICGNITAYADDAIFTTSSKNRETNQEKLKYMLDKMKTYLNNNKMTVNPSKTLLWEFMLKQKKCKTKGEPPHLVTLDRQSNIKIVRASPQEKCLGITLQENLQWQAFLETGEDPLIPALRKKLGILKYLGKNIPKKSKMLLANSLIIGKLNYMLPIYGGTHNKYLDKLQVILNMTARFITGAHKRTSSRTLMNSINWLNIRELVQYHTLIMAWKVVHHNTPQHLHNKINQDQDLKMTTMNPRLQNTELALRWRICNSWNELETQTRQINTLARYKSAVKTWIEARRTPDPGPADGHLQNTQ